jgi:hypothetical protein
MTTYTIKTRFVDITNGRIDENVRYGDGTRALAFWHSECMGRPEVVSVNLSEYDFVPPENHVYVRAGAQHEGMAETLEKVGVAKRVLSVVYGPFDSVAWLMLLTYKEGER